ncbi:9,11-endoperoxide prostaglandin H2 reductase-like isoform X2 [Xenia sp. Carnegie-2017]|uniref:9,11-endoperoxide prostaglandin H2 reductase-like isoform X2 n=1 Tax=Xenia sp. Carnegie-2017 TaxID=2897299 RepID=UPI001F042BD4|nr:9,11-endoperoxide prostaglandin H2 reductase-like isoform X2 [Xenia sp. Carnegie-2017]
MHGNSRLLYYFLVFNSTCLCYTSSDQCSNEINCGSSQATFQNYERRILLNDGNYIPTFGLGVWKIPKGHETFNAVTWALKAGYKQIDTAARYGNEESVGEALKNSGLPREDIYVTTKLYDDSHGYNETIEAFHKSLNRLGLKYIDLYLIHSPVNGKILSTWEAMVELQNKKLVRSIGVSNFDIHHLVELHKHTNVRPAVNQIEVHPFLQEKRLVKYCKDNGIVIQAYSPLASGRKLNEPRLLKLAKKYNSSPAVILIQWCLEKGYVCVAKSSNKDRIEVNLTAYGLVLHEEDINLLNSMEEGFRTCHEKIKEPWTG